MDKKKVLITTAIDYANDVIHIGHAYQKVLADCLSRFYRKILGLDKVYFLTGTDEYGSSNQKAAEKRGITPKEHVDEISARDKSELDSLNISYDRFIRTTDKDHNETSKRLSRKYLRTGTYIKTITPGFTAKGARLIKLSPNLMKTEDVCCTRPAKFKKLKKKIIFSDGANMLIF